MTDMTLPGIPATITRERVAHLLAELGIDPKRVPRSGGVTIAGDCIRCAVYALDDQGRMVLDGDEIAMHDIRIPIVEAP